MTKLNKIAPQLLDLTRYEVVVDGRVVGAVYQQETFSYRGTGGWGRGHRIADFSPARWFYTAPKLLRSESFATRRDAVAALFARLA